MRIGVDDTDSPTGMCTTYLGAVLIRRLQGAGISVGGARLIRLNPNVVYKTRGNAAVCIEAEGDPDRAFAEACRCVEELADFAGAETNPGVVVCETPPPPDFYYAALRDFCEIADARQVLEAFGARYRGYKNGRGLIGAAAAVSSELPDHTFELLAYRQPERWETAREVDPASIFRAEEATWPHTWDSVDRDNGVVVCVPHTPDPVLFGIRGESPEWVRKARGCILSEEPSCEQVYVTNQGTDAHLIPGAIGSLLEGRSYILAGRVAAVPATGVGGHVSVSLEDGGRTLRCMAYEPTKQFRDVIRRLIPGDAVVAVGSYKGGSLNLEKICIRTLAERVDLRPPICTVCGKRMTSAGSQKGYKCRRCGARATEPETVDRQRDLRAGWYEVPPTARRHLAKPLVRGVPDLPSV